MLPFLVCFMYCSLLITVAVGIRVNPRFFTRIGGTQRKLYRRGKKELPEGTEKQTLPNVPDRRRLTIVIH